MVESTNTTATLGATNSLCLDAKTLDLLVCPELRVAALANNWESCTPSPLGGIKGGTSKLIIYNQSSKSSFVVISLAFGQVTGPVIEMEQKKEK